jgi:dTDP-glucose 4,6-dehydratase
MNMLVTGGCGFIGSNFIRYILGKYKDYKVINLDKLTYAGNLKNLEDVKNNKNYKFIRGDICNKGLVDKIMKNADMVVHFAAETHVDKSIDNREEFVKTNVFGTLNLLNAALKNNARFHHISTDEVFGSLELDSQKKFDETSQYAPNSIYSASKAGSDHLVRAFFKTYGLAATVSNCSNNYGLNQYPEKLIPLIITNLIQNKKIPLYGNGRNVRDWINVLDHIKAVDLIIHNGKIGETYCIGGNCEKSNIEIARLILKEMDFDENMIEYVKDRPGHDLRYAISSSKISRELGWKPQKDFLEGIKETIEWYKKNRDWWINLKGKLA